MCGRIVGNVQREKDQGKEQEEETQDRYIDSRNGKLMAQVFLYRKLSKYSFYKNEMTNCL